MSIFLTVVIDLLALVGFIAICGVVLAWLTWNDKGDK